ncbi:hypothetical protein CPB84DRAFT_560417 [Gymnopilus junonius]|uniref:F-box domain-containing protein n=1 Tax=Gymnopilus junonius TaxID=109634 RepID=A0A9P5NC40_GYMJU|nr:hypothetical protein CPB84DRAFT_560417 [Gymnopilus junonius]
MSSDRAFLQLNPDVLRLIFALNADIFSNPSALLDTRLASQVCRSWRDVALSSPSLWGRLIDLEEFSNEANRDHSWVEEILRRSGDSLLWIRAYGRGCSSPVFIELLAKHWHRIQRLVLHVPLKALSAFSESDCTPEIRQVFERWPSIRLFADNVPFLREFHAPLYLKFDIQADWLAQLSSLRIGQPFAIQDVISCLQKTPNLEYLYVDHLEGTAKQFPPHVVLHLPNVSHCLLYSDFKSSITLLERLDIPSRCHVKVRPGNLVLKNMSLEFLESSFKLLSTITHRYLQTQQSREMHLKLLLSLRSFLLRDETPCDDLGNFEIFIMLDAQCPPHLLTFLFSEFAFAELSKVTELDLFFSVGNITKEATTFLSAFSSLKTIGILNKETLRNFQINFRQDGQPEDASRIMYPFVDVVKISFHIPWSSAHIIGKDGVIHQLLKSRLEQGYPIKVLDLSQGRAERTLPLQYLEEFQGMRVVWADKHNWKILEYECGSGHPEMLPKSFDFLDEMLLLPLELSMSR